MKIFTWLTTAALVVVCFAGWLMSEVVSHSLADVQAPLPYLTRLVIAPHGWLLAVPLPWVLYALFATVKREVTPSASLTFAGTALLGLALLVSVLAIALSLPYIPRHP